MGAAGLDVYEEECQAAADAKKYVAGLDIDFYKTTYDLEDSDVDALTEKLDNIKVMIDKGVDLLRNTDYLNYIDDLNARRWFVLMLLFWEAQQASEGKMKTHLTFPLLANGSNGYVMGKRGEFPIAIHGIYGMYGLEKGYIRVFNYTMLSDTVLSPFDRGHREVLLAAEGRATEMNQISELPKLLELPNSGKLALSRSALLAKKLVFTI